MERPLSNDDFTISDWRLSVANAAGPTVSDRSYPLTPLDPLFWATASLQTRYTFLVWTAAPFRQHQHQSHIKKN